MMPMSAPTSVASPIPDAIRLAAEAVALAGDDHDLAALVGRFWRYAPDEELVGLAPAAMLDAARTHRELAEQRLPGELKLEIAPSDDGDTTIVKIVTDDMPFLVDTVNAALAARGLDVHLLIHPLMVVRREPLGRLVEVLADVDETQFGAADGAAGRDRCAHRELDAPGDRPGPRAGPRRRVAPRPDPRAHRRARGRRRLAEDACPRALALADELLNATLPVPDKDITDGVELLRWLGADQFTFLGYREYKLDSRSYERRRAGTSRASEHRARGAGHRCGPDQAAAPRRTAPT